MDPFNWENWERLKEQEIKFKEERNIKEVLNTCLAFWDNPATLPTYGRIFPKIYYYMGRIKSYEGPKLFGDLNRNKIMMFVQYEMIELGHQLFALGIKYPNLTEDDYNEIEKLYCDPKYYDIMDDILFDQELLSKPLKKFDSTTRNIQNNSFTLELKQKIFEAYLLNCFVESEFDDGDYYYDRSKNSVVKMEDYDAADGIHFYIDIDLKLGKFSEYIKSILGEDFFFYFYNNVLDIEKTEFLDYVVINDEIFEQLLISINENREKFELPESAFQLLIHKIVEDWLITINSYKHYS